MNCRHIVKMLIQVIRTLHKLLGLLNRLLHAYFPQGENNSLYSVAVAVNIFSVAQGLSFSSVKSVGIDLTSTGKSVSELCYINSLDEIKLTAREK